MDDPLIIILFGILILLIGSLLTLQISLDCMKYRMNKIAMEKEPELCGVLSYFCRYGFMRFTYRKKKCKTKEIETFRIWARDVNTITLVGSFVGMILFFLVAPDIAGINMEDSLTMFLLSLIWMTGMFGALFIFLDYLKKRIIKIARFKEMELMNLSFSSLPSFIVFIFGKARCKTEQIELYRILAKNIITVELILFSLQLIGGLIGAIISHNT